MSRHRIGARPAFWLLTPTHPIAQAIADASFEGPLTPADLESIAPPWASLRVRSIDTLTSGLASIARLPFGTNVAAELAEGGAADGAALLPPKLTLYEYEACPFCRRVREVISHLDLVVEIVPCAKGSAHRAAVEAAAAEKGVTATYPYLVDRTAGVSMFESADIVAHLVEKYGRGAELPSPQQYFLPSLFVSGWAPSLLRPGRGTAVRHFRKPAADGAGQARAATAEGLTLYSYEGNQFCRLVREVLTELDIPYTLAYVAKVSSIHSRE